MSNILEYVEFNITLSCREESRNLTMSASMGERIVLDIEWSDEFPYSDDVEELVSYHLLECSGLQPGAVEEIAEYINDNNELCATWAHLFDEDEDGELFRIIRLTVDAIVIHDVEEEYAA